MRIGLAVLAAVVLSVTVACDRGITTPTRLAVASINPSFVPAGSIIDVTIRGTGFRTGATVSAGLAATEVVVVDSTLITAAVLAHGAGPVDVVVTNPNGESTTLAGGLTFVTSLLSPVGHGPKAVVTGTLEASQMGAEPEPVSYVFNLTLTESSGVPATINSVWISFDDGWGGECSWTPDKLGQTRLPARGTLALGPLTCSDGGVASNVEVSIGLKDDNAYQHSVSFFRAFVVR